VSRLARYLTFLEHDPANPALLADATEAAVDARRPDQALDLLDRLAEAHVVLPAHTNLRGMALLQKGDVAGAADMFSALLAAGHDDPGLRFNLAWSKAVLNEHASALELLDDATLAISPKAPPLRIQALHHLGRLDEALAEGERLLVLFPDNTALAGALSVVATDAGDMPRAAAFAAHGGNSSDALTTLGLIALSGEEPDKAIALFDRALGERSDHPRAWLGRGLVRLRQGEVAAATHDLETAATQFGAHIGSWLAAGWGWFTQGNMLAARRCFETALALDENFAESHGSLAVLDLAAGKIEQARRQTSVALRLNRQCFSGALAKSLLAEHDNNPLLAQKIRERAMAVPIGPNGQTIAEAITTMRLTPLTRRGPLS